MGGELSKQTESVLRMQQVSSLDVYVYDIVVE
jgi:hypothetical protein